MATLVNRHTLLASKRCVARTRLALPCNSMGVNMNMGMSNANSRKALASCTINSHQPNQHQSRFMSGFSFAGPRSLHEIMKTELLEGKTKAEISEIWMTYHEEKERVHGAILKGSDGVKILERAEKL